MPWLRLRTLALAMLAQSGAALAVLLLPLAPEPAPAVEFGRACAQGCAAAALGQALRLPRWWLPINAALPPLAALLLMTAIAPAWYFAAFAVAFLVFGTGPLRSGVPLFSSPPAAAQALAGLLRRDRPARVLDAGSGSGALLLALARLRPDAELRGIESGLAPWALARLRAALTRALPHFQRGDFWAADFGGYDLVYAFLSTAAMPQLWEKARREMRPGTLLVSLDFAVPGVAPARVLALGGGARRLHLWHM